MGNSQEKIKLTIPIPVSKTLQLDWSKMGKQFSVVNSHRKFLSVSGE